MLSSSWKHRLFYIGMIVFLALTVASSYYRFVIANDYHVTYEIDCDPTTDYCFIGCEDDECTEEYYYKEIERHAQELSTLCSADITDCEEALSCPADNTDCSVYTCSLSDGPDICLGPET